jgi:triacylglycerol esterase/lipase EstA (alpha/beta hydrolase family)
MRRRIVGLVAVLGVLAVAPAAAHAALPVVYSDSASYAYGATHVNGSPPGANDFSCRPTAAHPYPVVLVHGTIENMAQNWFTLSPLLKNNGYCVFALNYGQTPGRYFGTPGAAPAGGTGRIEDSAAQLGAFVDRVLSATGASKVDVVGHSQGGMMPRYWMRFLGGASKVHDLVGLSSSNHGTTLGGFTALIDAIPGGRGGVGTVCGTACEEQLAGSPFMQKLNAGGDTDPGVNYTVIETKYDEVVTPYTSAFLSGANNITLQSQCALDGSDHLATPFDHIALRDVLNALDPAHAVAPVCTPVAPYEGG